MKKLLLALGLLALGPLAHAQAPDCSFSFQLTASADAPVQTGFIASSVTGFDNRTKGCTGWTVTYASTGFSVVSITFQTSTTPNNTPSSWSTYGGTVVTGINPNTSTTGATTKFQDGAVASPWVRIHASLTGTGLVVGLVTGYRPGLASISGAAAGAAGGDLSGTYPNPTVAAIDGTTVPASPTVHQVLIVTASGTATWKTVPDCPSSSISFAQSTNSFGCNNAGAYSAGFTSQTSVAFTHNLNTTDLTFSCQDAGSPPNWILPNSVAFTDVNTATVTFSVSQSGRCTFSSGGAGGGSGSSSSVGGTNSIAFSATPAFDLSLGWLQKITLTASVTSSSVSNPGTGLSYTFEICQDSTGGWTYVWPATFHGTMVIGATASKCNLQTFVYDGSAYFAITPGVINE